MQGVGPGPIASLSRWLVLLLLCGGPAAPGTGRDRGAQGQATAASPTGPRARRRTPEGYSLLLGLIDAAPEVDDLRTTRRLTWRVGAGPGQLWPACPPSAEPGRLARAARSFTVSWLLRAGDARPRPWGRLPLTYFGWPALEPWAKTHSSPGAGHLPAAGGVRAGLAGPWGWWL